MPQPNSSELIDLLSHAARAENWSLVSDLLHRYRQYLWIMARAGLDRSLRSKADPSDVVQETLIRASLHFGSFVGSTERELVSWLRSILHQELALLYRHFHAKRRHVGRERSLHGYLNQSSAALETLGASSLSRPDALPKGDVAGVLLADALSELSSDYREVIILRSLEQLEWSRVAEQMGRSTEAVRKLWVRALLDLRPLIEKRT